MGGGTTKELESRSAQKLLFWAAEENGVQLSQKLKAQVNRYREALLGNLFLEHYLSSRVLITMDEIRDHYLSNRDTYRRTTKEVRVLSFLVLKVEDATKVKAGLLQYNADIRASLIEKHRAVPSTLSPGDMSLEIDNLLFGSIRPRGIIGPIETSQGFYLFDVLEVFSKDTFRGLDEVYDFVSQDLYRSKRALIYSGLLDSLRLVYSVNSLGVKKEKKQ